MRRGVFCTAPLHGLCGCVQRDFRHLHQEEGRVHRANTTPLCGDAAQQVAAQRLHGVHGGCYNDTDERRTAKEGRGGMAEPTTHAEILRALRKLDVEIAVGEGRIDLTLRRERLRKRLRTVKTDRPALAQQVAQIATADAPDTAGLLADDAARREIGALIAGLGQGWTPSQARLVEHGEQITIIVQGDVVTQEITISGNEIGGSTLNVGSGSQQITQAPEPLPEATPQEELRALVGEILGLLQKVPDEHGPQAQRAARRLQAALDEAQQPEEERDEKVLESNLSGFQKAAAELQETLPGIVATAATVAMQIARVVGWAT